MTTKSMHMTMTKEFCISMINQYGAKKVLAGFEGTDEEAIELIQNDPYEVLIVGECDNRDERGFCKGHTPGSYASAIAHVTAQLTSRECSTGDAKWIMRQHLQ